jgi:RHS repeat-associated protein
VYDGLYLLAEVDSTGGLRRAYTHGPGIDNWLAMTVYTGVTVKTYFYLTDHQGTVHALADDSGAIVESYCFDAFGRVLGVYNGSGQPLTESAVGNRFLWQGKQYSFQSGLYDNRVRVYDPITGRFLSKDPIGVSGGLHEYLYCYGNPLNLIDYDGKEPTAIVISGGLGFEVPTWIPGVIAAGPPIAAGGAGLIIGGGLGIGVDWYWKWATGDSLSDRIGRWLGDILVPMAEHVKNPTPSNREPHEKGRERLRRDQGREKGDQRRAPRNRKRNDAGRWYWPRIVVPGDVPSKTYDESK